MTIPLAGAVVTVTGGDRLAAAAQIHKTGQDSDRAYSATAGNGEKKKHGQTGIVGLTIHTAGLVLFTFVARPSVDQLNSAHVNISCRMQLANSRRATLAVVSLASTRPPLCWSTTAGRRRVPRRTRSGTLSSNTLNKTLARTTSKFPSSKRGSKY